MEKYIEFLINNGINYAKVIEAKTIAVESWVVFKCQYGCSNYDTSWCCPPRTPDPAKMREIVRDYKTAILFSTHNINLPTNQAFKLARMLFLDGYYKAIALGSGPCRKCKDFKNCVVHHCANSEIAIPSMEACGINVFQTAHKNGFNLAVTRDENDDHNYFGMVLVE